MIRITSIETSGGRTPTDGTDLWRIDHDRQLWPPTSYMNRYQSCTWRRAS